MKLLTSLKFSLTWPFIFKEEQKREYYDDRQKKSKLTGFTYAEIVSQWVASKFINEHIIVLLSVNVEAKNIQFWAKVPQTEMVHFFKDVIILRCKDKTEVQRLVDNIPQDFAEAYGFSAGILFTYNMEEFK